MPVWLPQFFSLACVLFRCYTLQEYSHQIIPDTLYSVAVNNPRYTILFRMLKSAVTWRGGLGPGTQGRVLPFVALGLCVACFQCWWSVELQGTVAPYTSCSAGFLPALEGL